MLANPTIDWLPSPPHLLNKSRTRFVTISGNLVETEDQQLCEQNAEDAGSTRTISLGPWIRPK